MKDGVPMHPSRKRPKEGDVFVIQPKQGVYFYGKVIRAQFSNAELVAKGMNLIYVYQTTSREPVLPETLSPEQLLIAPQIVNNQGWLKGYFQTVGSLPVTDEDRTVNYGFRDMLKERYVDEEGKLMKVAPVLQGIYGVGNYATVLASMKLASRAALFEPLE